MSTVHNLRLGAKGFDNAWQGRKTFLQIVCADGTNVVTGDKLLVYEDSDAECEPTGRSFLALVIYTEPGGEGSVIAGFVLVARDTGEPVLGVLAKLLSAKVEAPAPEPQPVDVVQSALDKIESWKK